MRIVLGSGPGAGEPHFVLVYRMPSGEFFSYDGDRSRCLGRVEPHVIDIAEAYSPGARDPKWITEMDDEHVKGQRQLDRRLFPWEETTADAKR